METLTVQCSVEGCDKPRRPDGAKCHVHKGRSTAGKCATCGADFTTSSARKYCSQECYRASRPKKPTKLHYCVCGKQITRYATGCASCSRKGQRAWNKGELVAITCEICGTVVERIPSQAEGARYCSPACSHEAKRRVSGEAHPLFKVKPVIACAFCGKMFSCKPSEVHRKRFCSTSCNGSYSIRKQGGRASSIERAVAEYLTLRNVVFEQQVRIDRFLVDFLIGDLVVEVDGVYWHSLPGVVERDIRKASVFAQAGYSLLRLTEAEVRASDFASLDAALSSATDSGE